MAAVASLPSPPIQQSTLRNSIREQEDEDDKKREANTDSSSSSTPPYKHCPTTLHPKPPAPRGSNAGAGAGDDHSVSCNRCKPSSREKNSIVPFDINGSSSSSLSPNFLRSLFHSLTRRTPKSSTAASREEEWRLAATELSLKLLQVTRRRDEALLEASRLKSSVSDLERKLSRLESYCYGLRPSTTAVRLGATGSLDVDPFLRAVSDARSAVRQLSRALVAEVRAGSAGPRALDRIAGLLLQPHDVRIGGDRSLLIYVEALLNRVFYAEFEAAEDGAALDPAVRCESNRAAWEAVRSVGWDDVLSKGTRFYSEGLSRFCDRRMSDVVVTLGWARAWHEGLLRDFFMAAKGAWAVHLLARSVHPPVPLLRVDRGVRFEPGFMEDVAASRARRLEPETVQVMVAPGFYVYSENSNSCGVVKCKVLAAYTNHCNNSEGGHCSNGTVNVDESKDDDGKKTGRD